jgi:Zn-dependent alcohol dehydrogenase
MKTIAAVQAEIGGKLLLGELELPDPGPDQVTVKLYSSGVCHSQLHQMHNPGLGRPLLLGHEGTGVVTRTGSNVTHVKEGDQVIVTWVPRTPSRGPMTREMTGATFNGQAAHGTVYTWARDVQTSKELVVPIPHDHPRDLSCIVGCAVLTGAGAVLHTASVRPNESVAIFGVGGVGLSAIRAAAILEANPIIAVDLDDEKLAFARSFGATHTINASGNVDPVEAIHELTKGGVDYAFDAIGKERTIEQILRAVRPGGVGADNFGGTAVLVGVPQEKVTLDPGLFLYGQRTYRGSLGASFPDQDFPMYLRWHKEGKFPLDRLVTRRYSLEQINEACHDLHTGKILGRAILEF